MNAANVSSGSDDGDLAETGASVLPPLGVAFGLIFGSALGALIFDDVGIGSAVGMFIGIVAVTIIEWRRRRSGSVGPRN